MSSSVLEQAEKMIPAECRMISGCRDAQTSADVSNVANFQLPDPAGRAGGACTSGHLNPVRIPLHVSNNDPAMLKVLYADHHAPDEDLSFQEVLLKMRGILSKGGFTQIPQLSSSRPLDIHTPFRIVPENFSGTRRAVVIAINYVGQQGELRGCQNDAHNMIDYIKNVHGFKDENITILMDDGVHTNPTYDKIMKAFRDLVAAAQPGDAVFTHYSGHGGKLRDDDGDEKDGYDETLVPIDYATKGQIRDDDIFTTLVGAMPRGVTMTSVMDCCHSGSVLDLPYVFVADGESEEMAVAPEFDMTALIGLFNTFMAAQAASGAAGGANGDDAIMQMAQQCCSIL